MPKKTPGREPTPSDSAHAPSPTVQFAFCETIAASVTHIRRLSAAGRKPNGGVDTPALCGADALWDTSLAFSRDRVEHWNPWPYPLCKRCGYAFIEADAEVPRG